MNRTHSSTSPLVSATHLSHAFDYTLFEDIDIDIEQGQSIAVLGVSGSGKSTLLHILATLLRPQSGEVLFQGKSLYDLSPKELLKIRRFEMGIIFQSHYLFKGFSVEENLEISSLLSKQKLDKKLLENLGIDTLLKQNVSELSGGQQQRVSIARILLKKPRLIFADEPTGNLDRETADDVMDVMLSFINQSQGGLFIVTHDERVAARCDVVYRLKDKRLVLERG
jgi:putative ABC transport system ATP-binding protein